MIEFVPSVGDVVFTRKVRILRWAVKSFGKAFLGLIVRFIFNMYIHAVNEHFITIDSILLFV